MQVARITAVSVGVIYGSMKLAYLKVQGSMCVCLQKFCFFVLVSLMLLAFNDMNYCDLDNTLELVFLTALMLSAFDDVNCHDLDNTFRVVFFI
jgi:hypothetical protein